MRSYRNIMFIVFSAAGMAACAPGAVDGEYNLGKGIHYVFTSPNTEFITYNGSTPQEYRILLSSRVDGYYIEHDVIYAARVPDIDITKADGGTASVPGDICEYWKIDMNTLVTTQIDNHGRWSKRLTCKHMTSPFRESHWGQIS